jgi:hypothetical protein
MMVENYRILSGEYMVGDIGCMVRGFGNQVSGIRVDGAGFRV